MIPTIAFVPEFSFTDGKYILVGGNFGFSDSGVGEKNTVIDSIIAALMILLISCDCVLFSDNFNDEFIIASIVSLTIHVFLFSNIGSCETLFFLISVNMFCP